MNQDYRTPSLGGPMSASGSTTVPNTYTATEMTKAKPAMQRVQERIENEVTGLQQVIDQLCEKLAPVRQPRAEVGSDSTMAPRDVPSSCPLAEQLDGSADRIESARVTLSRLLDDLQV